jgi:hypothetical protein
VKDSGSERGKDRKKDRQKDGEGIEFEVLERGCKYCRDRQREE